MPFYPIIKSKLVSPEVADQFIYLERLKSLHKLIMDNRITEICAPAGYGKTSLVASINKSSHFGRSKVFWYRLEEEDSSAGVFYAHLLEMLFGEKGKGEEAWKCLQSLDGIEEASGLMNALICNELSSDKSLAAYDKVLIILDDFHHAAYSPVVISSVQYLVSNLPANFRLIVSGRVTTTILDGKLKITQPVCRMDAKDLTFTKSETEMLAATNCRNPLSTDLSGWLQASTEGWVAGIVLLCQAFNAGGIRSLDLNDISKTGKEHIFQYFFAEILRTLQSDFREFLLKSSIFQEFTAEEVSNLFQIAEANRYINRCIQEGLYIQTIKLDLLKPSYRFHALFREALKQLMEQYFSQAEIKALYLQTADYLLAKKSYHQAVEVLLSAGEKEKAIDLLVTEGQSLLNQGYIEQVRTWLETIPEEVVEGNPMLLYYRGYVKQNTDFEKALADLEEAAEGFTSQKNPGMQARAYITMTVTHSLRNNVTEVKRIAAKIPIFNAFLKDKWSRGVLLVSALCQAAWDDRLQQGQWLIRIVRRLNLEDDWKWASCAYSCMIYYRLGELDLAEKAILEAFKLNLIKNNEIWRGYALNLYHVVLWLKNDETTAPKIRSELIDIGEKYGSEYCLAYGKRAAAFIRYYEHDLKQGLRLLDESINHFKRIDNLPMVCISKLDRCLWLAEKVDPRQNVQEALHIFSELSALEAGQGLLETGQSILGAVASLAGETELATSHLRASIGVSKSKKASQLLCGSYFHLANLYLLEGRLSEAEEELVKAMHIASSRGYVIFWDLHFTVLARCLILAVSKNIYRDYAVKLIAKHFGTEALSSVEDNVLNTHSSFNQEFVHYFIHRFIGQLKKEQISVRINVFGHFNLIVNGKTIPEDEWKTKKVVGVLKYLAVNYNKRISREVLMGTFWPDSEPKAAAVSLRAALYGLRKSLDRYGLNPEGSSPLLTENKAGLALSKGAAISLDLQEYDSLCKTLKQNGLSLDNRIKLLEQLQSLYQGNLLESDPYDDWLLVERESYKNSFSTYSLELARLWAERGKNDKAEAVILRLLQFEPYYDDAYYQLIRIYLQTGRKEKAITLFSSYKKALASDLGTEPDERFEGLFV